MDEQKNWSRVEPSDPDFEFDHLRFLTFKSEAIQGRVDVTLFMPPGQESATNLPLLLLLHGVYGSHWAWALKGGAHKTALDLIESAGDQFRYGIV